MAVNAAVGLAPVGPTTRNRVHARERYEERVGSEAAGDRTGAGQGLDEDWTRTGRGLDGVPCRLVGRDGERGRFCERNGSLTR